MLLPLLISIAAAGVCLCTVFGFLGRGWWRFDLLSHFRVQYAALLLMAAAALILLGQPAVAIASGLFGLLNLALILPFYGRRPAPKTFGARHRLLLCNVLQENQQYDQILKLVAAAKPDFVALLETGEQWIDALAPLKEIYPYFQHEFWGEENYDVALFSRIPPEGLAVQHFGPLHTPTIIGRFTLDGLPLTLIVTHSAPPKTRLETEARNAQMAAIAPWVKDQPGAVMLVGDLNMTSWSTGFQDFIRSSGLRDSRIGHGLQPTWPTTSPLMMIPIDHVLISQRIRVERRYLGPRVGSDHLPVLVDFSL